MANGKAANPQAFVESFSKRLKESHPDVEFVISPIYISDQALNKAKRKAQRKARVKAQRNSERSK
jgi:hypothetical protein